MVFSALEDAYSTFLGWRDSKSNTTFLILHGGSGDGTAVTVTVTDFTFDREMNSPTLYKNYL